ncbi:MAG: DNA repair and recombination protein RadB [Thermoplasmata archaeon]
MTTAAPPPAAPGGAAAERVPTGAVPIDRLLEGGLEPDGITELYGEGGTGKTVLCLSATLRVALTDRWVCYIDTEGVSADRLEVMAGASLSRVLDRLLLASPRNLEEQAEAVRTACALARDGRRPIGLIVLDSATMFYRLTLGSSAEEEGRASLLGQLSNLLATALAVQVPVLVTNQVWRNVALGTLEPLGGPSVNHLSKTILRLERSDGGRRRAVLVKHRSLGERDTAYRITSLGIENPGRP